jgi:hypothetical protein
MIPGILVLPFWASAQHKHEGTTTPNKTEMKYRTRDFFIRSSKFLILRVCSRMPSHAESAAKPAHTFFPMRQSFEAAEKTQRAQARCNLYILAAK